METPVVEEPPVMEEIPAPTEEPEPETPAMEELVMEPIVETPVVEEPPVMEEIPAPTEEPVNDKTEQAGFLSDFEISNDMFDMGFDFSDEPDYSDENIDLSAFRGSIKDAEEINAQLDHNLNLDEQPENQSTTDFDMSNLVAAALNDLSKRNEEEEEQQEDTPVLDLSISSDTSELEDAEELHAGEDVQTEDKLESQKELIAGEEEVPESTIELRQELQAGPEQEEMAEIEIRKELDVLPGPNTEASLDENESLQAGEKVVEDSVLANDEEIDVETENVLPVMEDNEPQTESLLDNVVESEIDSDGTLEVVVEESDVEASVEFITKENEEDEESLSSFVESEENDGDNSEEMFIVGETMQEQEESSIVAPSAEIAGDVEFVTNLVAESEPEENEEVPTASNLFKEETSISADEVALENVHESVQEPVAESVPEFAATENSVVKPEIPTQDDLGMQAEEEPVATEQVAEEQSFKMVFEPAFPGAERMMDVGGFDSGNGSLIIEDYVEVPTVAQVEEDLKKQEKEKKRFRGRKGRQQESEGFAYSLDDLENPGPVDEPHDKKPEFRLNESVKQRILAEEKKAAEAKVVPTVSAVTESAATQTSLKPTGTLVIGQQVVHKEGKNKRTYFRLIYQ